MTQIERKKSKKSSGRKKHAEMTFICPICKRRVGFSNTMTIGTRKYICIECFRKAYNTIAKREGMDYDEEYVWRDV